MKRNTILNSSWGTARRAVAASCAVGLLLALAAAVRADFPYEREPISYSGAKANDIFSQLQKKINAGEVKLKYDAELGYLPSLLEALKMLPSSQTLVFSKTSFQRSKISPRTPRAVYFNDVAYVGFCQKGDLLELAAVDPQLGTVFYSLDQQENPRPQIVRHNDQCLVCHATSRTVDVPGLLVRSVFPEPGGEPVYRAGTYDVDHTTPFEQRWGGWYVSGTHGDKRHLGNVLLRESEDPADLDTAAGANVTNLSPLFDTAPYLTPHSDITALLVLEHQARMHNLLTRANFETRSALWYNAEMNKAFQQPADHRSESTERRIRKAAEDVVSYLLFAEESPLKGPLKGTSQYAAEFEALGPVDKKGRSLRQFDLKQRLFKYPCSYLIYGEQFEGLPNDVKAAVYEQLFAVLSGANTSETFARISAESRQEILEILRETKPGLPAYYLAEKPAAKPAP